MSSDPHRTPQITLSPRWQYSLKHLLLWTAIVALFCVALKNASAAWVAASFAVVHVALIAAVLLVVFRRGAVRAYWIGFAITGWLYLGVLIYGWNLDPMKSYGNPLAAHRLATTTLSSMAYQELRPDIDTEAISDQRVFDAYMNFINVAHALWTLLLAAGSGVFARWLYMTGPAKDDAAQVSSRESAT
jgi:hypothetical protein